MNQRIDDDLGDRNKYITRLLLILKTNYSLSFEVEVETDWGVRTT